jgi:hypothetical protein
MEGTIEKGEEATQQQTQAAAARSHACIPTGNKAHGGARRRPAVGA